MHQKRALIVGAGIGGLTLAVRLARKGWAVEVFEAKDVPGGRLGQVKGDGYTFDLGPTIVLMPDVFQRFFSELGLRLEDYLTFQPLDPNYRLHFADGSTMAASSNLQRMMTEIEKISPSDLDGFMRYLSYMYKRYQIARHDFIEQPMLSTRELLQPSIVKKLLQLRTLNTMAQDISRFIKDERLKTALTFQSLYIGIDPFEAPSIYNVIGFMELSYSGVWYCKGGYHQVAKVFSTLAERLGVRIHYNSRVAQVLTDGGKATGVKLENGATFTAPTVIVNADYPIAAKTLISPEDQGKHTTNRLNRMRQSCSTFMMYLGSRKRYPHAEVHSVYFAKDFRRNMRQLFTDLKVPDDPSFYAHVPTRIDTTVAPADREAIYVLVPVPNNKSGIDWSKSAPGLRAHILNRLEAAGFTDLSQSLEFERIITPADWEHDLALEAGAAFGVLPTLRQSAYWRPSLKSKSVDGLYFLGASTHPGGGVPIVMTGAFALEQVIEADMSDAFQTEPVEKAAPRARAVPTVSTSSMDESLTRQEDLA